MVYIFSYQFLSIIYLIYIAAVLSAFFAVAWASLVEFFDHRVYSPDQMSRHLGAPVAGVVSDFTPKETASASRFMRGAA